MTRVNRLVANTRSCVGGAKCDVVSDAELVSGSFDRFDCEEDVLEFKQVLYTLRGKASI